mmetsp:Transcript_22211/g.59938  ORF Transcript_22211/g.59938 Transcript_22211/m.59938 type:complete len:264 (-) Transcript_22211:158-949(-)
MREPTIALTRMIEGVTHNPHSPRPSRASSASVAVAMKTSSPSAAVNPKTMRPPPDIRWRNSRSAWEVRVHTLHAVQTIATAQVVKTSAPSATCTFARRQSTARHPGAAWIVTCPSHHPASIARSSLPTAAMRESACMAPRRSQMATLHTATRRTIRRSDGRRELRRSTAPKGAVMSAISLLVSSPTSANIRAIAAEVKMITTPRATSGRCTRTWNRRPARCASSRCSRIVARVRGDVRTEESTVRLEHRAEGEVPGAAALASA